MSVQFIQKKSAGTETSPTSIGDDATGKSIIENFSRACGIAYDRAANLIKYNGNDAIKTLVSETDAQTLTNKTLTSPVINGAQGTGAAEIVTATNVILAAESGKTFFLNSATEFVSTLPAPALGLKFRFIVAAAPSGASYTVIAAASATIIKGHVVTSQDAGGSGQSSTSGVLTLTFVDGVAVVGDWAEFECDGTNWYVNAAAKAFAAITLS